MEGNPPDLVQVQVQLYTQKEPKKKETTGTYG